MPINNVERYASGFLLGCMGFLVIAVASSILFVAFNIAKPQERALLIGLALVMAVAPAAIPLGVLMLRSQSGKHKQFLQEVAARLQGSLEMPGLFTLVAAPRVDANRNGFPVEVRLLRQRHRAGSLAFASMVEAPNARLGARYLIPGYRIHIRIHRTIAVRFILMTRTRLGSLGASAAGVHEMASGDPAVDQDIVAVTDRPDLLGSSWQDPDFRDGCLPVIRFNAPYFARADMSSRGIEWLGVWSEQVTPDVAAWIVDSLFWWAQQVESRTAQTASRY